MADEPSQLHQLRALMAGLHARQRERARLLAQLRLAADEAFPATERDGAADVVDPIPPTPGGPPPLLHPPVRPPPRWRRWLAAWRRPSGQN